MNQDVLIYGSGPCALRMAHNLAEHGVGVWLAADKAASVPHGGIRLLEGARPVRCNGYAGEFEVILRRNDGNIACKVGAVAVATEEHRRPNFEDYGLVPSPHVLDIAALEDQLAHDSNSSRGPFASAERIVFLNGLQQDSHPKVFARMLAACLGLQKQGTVQTFLIAGNLKVAADGLEASCQAARSAGTVFIKCTERLPDLQAMPDGRIRIDYRDELTRDDCRLAADCVVVDETLGPDPILVDLSRSMGLEQDRLGFAQNDNVRRMNNLTNRRGIFMAGSARGVLTDDEIERDADQAALEIMAFLSDADREDLPRVQIDPGRCARCLTCHRICPHGAIEIGMHMAVVSQACQSCGICAASCPARAIDVEGLAVDQAVHGTGRQTNAAGGGKNFDPRIVVFGCARSAGPARRLAGVGGCSLPGGVQFVEVPCGGAIALQNLLTAFESGAHGVLVCTCHEDNCKSQQGSGQARRKAASAMPLLDLSGIESDRLQIFTLAANMGGEFCRAVAEFHQKIKTLGPWHLD